MKGNLSDGFDKDGQSGAKLFRPKKAQNPISVIPRMGLCIPFHSDLLQEAQCFISAFEGQLKLAFADHFFTSAGSRKSPRRG